MFLVMSWLHEGCTNMKDTTSVTSAMRQCMNQGSMVQPGWEESKDGQAEGGEGEEAEGDRIEEEQQGWRNFWSELISDILLVLLQDDFNECPQIYCIKIAEICEIAPEKTI